MSAALAFVAGFVDAATFVRGGVFCAHVTGNLIVIAAQFIHDHHVGGLTAATIPTFVLTVAVVASLYRKRARASEVVARRAVLCFEAAFIGLGCLLAAIGGEDSLRVWVVLSLVVAMAAQTTLQRMTPSLITATTVMTGNLAQCFLELTGDIRRSWATSTARIVCAFIMGCLSGAALVKWFGFGMLVLPLFVLWRIGLRDAGAHSTIAVLSGQGDGLRATGP